MGERSPDAVLFAGAPPAATDPGVPDLLQWWSSKHGMAESGAAGQREGQGAYASMAIASMAGSAAGQGGGARTRMPSWK